MSGMESDTIDGYNSMLEKQKAVDGKCMLTTVLFDHHYELLHDRIDIRAVEPITEKEYQVGGCTALLDAVGMTIHKIAAAQKNTKEEFRAEKVMFVIITDGAENSSREYSLQEVRNQIERQKEKYEWEFIFLGANIDAVQTAGQMGIRPNRAVDYLRDSKGTRLNFQMMGEAVAEFRVAGSVPEECLDAIRKDVKKRGNFALFKVRSLSMCAWRRTFLTGESPESAR